MPKVPMTQDAKKYKPKDLGLKVRFTFSFVEMKWNHNEDKWSLWVYVCLYKTQKDTTQADIKNRKHSCM